MSDPLLVQEDARGIEGRWEEFQLAFVGQPQRAVEQADALVSELLEKLTRPFVDNRGAPRGAMAQRRRSLHGGPPPDTHPLLLVLQTPSFP